MEISGRFSERTDVDDRKERWRMTSGFQDYSESFVLLLQRFIAIDFSLGQRENRLTSFEADVLCSLICWANCDIRNDHF